MAIPSRRTCLKALLLAVFAIQIYGAAASSKKAVGVDNLTTGEIEEQLQVCTRLSYASIVRCSSFVKGIASMGSRIHTKLTLYRTALSSNP